MLNLIHVSKTGPSHDMIDSIGNKHKERLVNLLEQNDQGRIYPQNTATMNQFLSKLL